MPTQLLGLFYKMAGHTGMLVAAGGALAVDFRDQITLGSIIATATVVVLAGVFTIRSKIATVWRDEAAGEKARAYRLQGELDAERADRLAAEKEHNEIREGFRETIAEQVNKIHTLEARTDLTTALEAIRQMNTSIDGSVVGAIAAATTRSEERDERILKLLEEIRDRLPPSTITATLGDTP